MQQRRLLLIGLAALVAAGLLTAVAYRALVSRAMRGTQKTAKTVVAAKDLAVGTMIGAADLKLIDYPAGDLPTGALADPTKAVGRGVVVAMKANEPLLESKLAEEKAGAGLPAMIPRNMRAVSVQVNEVISVAGFVIPGTRVDVLVTGSPDSRNPNNGAMTTTVLENVEVLAAGQQIQPNEEGKPEKVPVITLLVSPEDAQRLTLASAEGKIQLALRNPLDSTKSVPGPVNNAALYGVPAPEHKTAVSQHVAAKKKPEVAPEPLYTVEVIRGDKRDISKF